MKFKHLILFEMIYLILFFLLFSGFQYNIDPDATGYFSVAEHFANGDYFKSINGIWSPLSSWLVVPLIRAGFDPVLSVKCLNGFYGCLILGVFFVLLKKYVKDKRIAFWVNLTAIVLTLNFVYSRLFGDLLQLFLLLTYINLVTGEGFVRSYVKIFWAAVLGGICFYAKAITFYFILLHLPLVILILEKNEGIGFLTFRGFKKILLTIFILVLMVAPWALAIKSKYGSYSLSNNSLTGLYSQLNPPNKILFYKPLYDDSYSVWDDLSYWNVSTIKPFSNKDVIFFQIKVIFSNLKNLIGTFNNFSFVFITIFIASFVLCIKKKRISECNAKILIILSAIVFWSALFSLLHIEARFMYVIALLGLLLTGDVLTKEVVENLVTKRLFHIISIITILSFWVYPIDEIKNQFGDGEHIHKMAEAFKQKNITGNIISRNYDGNVMDKTVILNYLIKGKYYGPVLFDFTTDDILDAIEKYHIDYFVLYFNNNYQKDEILYSIVAKKATSVLENIYPNVIVLSFKNHEFKKN